MSSSILSFLGNTAGSFIVGCVLTAGLNRLVDLTKEQPPTPLTSLPYKRLALQSVISSTAKAFDIFDPRLYAGGLAVGALARGVKSCMKEPSSDSSAGSLPYQTVSLIEKAGNMAEQLGIITIFGDFLGKAFSAVGQTLSLGKNVCTLNFQEAEITPILKTSASFTASLAGFLGLTVIGEFGKNLGAKVVGAGLSTLGSGINKVSSSVSGLFQGRPAPTEEEMRSAVQLALQARQDYPKLFAQHL